MEESQKRFDNTEDENKSLNQQQQSKVVTGEFETYLLNALNDSLIKKSNQTIRVSKVCV